MFLCYNIVAVQNLEATVDDQTAAAQSSQNSDTTPPPVNIAEPRRSETTQPATQQQLADVEKQMSSFESATLRWARIAVLLSGLASLFMCAQWYEMHTTGMDTHDLAVAAKTQAEKMKTMSDAADKIKEAAQNMVIQDQRIADNAQKALEASNRQSRAALDESIATARSDQRAWVGAVAAETPKDLAVGKQGRFGWVIVNNGKTPALDVEQEIAAWPFTKGQECSPVYTENPAGTPKHSITVLQPGMRVTVWTYPQMRPNTEENINNLKAGNEVMCVYGRMTYKDVFRRIHHTRFCAWLDTDLSTFNSCTGYNHAD